jgi:hypothetical protein
MHIAYLITLFITKKRNLISPKEGKVKNMNQLRRLMRKSKTFSRLTSSILVLVKADEGVDVAQLSSNINNCSFFFWIKFSSFSYVTLSPFCAWQRPVSEMMRYINKFKSDFGGNIISLERVQPSLDHVPHR